MTKEELYKRQSQLIKMIDTLAKKGKKSSKIVNKNVNINI